MSTLAIPYSFTTGQLRGDYLAANFDEVRRFINGEDDGMGGVVGIEASNLQSSARIGPSLLRQPRSLVVVTHVFLSGSATAIAIPLPAAGAPCAIALRMAVRKSNTAQAKAGLGVRPLKAWSWAQAQTPDRASAYTGLILYDDDKPDNWGAVRVPVEEQWNLGRGDDVLDLRTFLWSSNVTAVLAQVEFAFWHTF